ncbi:stage II sporulation protein M [Microbacterium sp. G2-8]|uniref:stage II sporulation protein M n=1 Tax=Microbacterium sp. G2-8 TaxID=2842454 RepID=UPI001C8B03FD|nr:stage II sporulation protein M [Microbacterium sp. G2-8]
MTSETTPSTQHLRVPVWRRPFRLIGENRRAYLLINAAAYGLGLLGFALGLAFPELVAARTTAMVDDGTADLVTRLVNFPPLFAVTILAVNVLRLSLLTIVLPSLIIPFAGLVLFGYWSVQTGITLAPTDAAGWVALIPHALTILIEFQAYILLALGAYRLGAHWLFPHSSGAPTRRQGYLRGLRETGLLALPALMLLVIGALWEAYSLRYLVHPLNQMLL